MKLTTPERDVAKDDLTKICQFIMKHGYATGHADDMDDALAELGRQLDEQWEKFTVLRNENEALIRALKSPPAPKGE